MIFPDYFRIVQKTTENWTILGTKCFSSINGRKYNPDVAWTQFNITKQDLIVELFRRFQGKLGYYIADLKNKRYYYCGLSDLDIQTTLHSIGIGGNDNA